MKKIAVILVLVFVLGVLFSSCRHSSMCPAYGEYRQFQKERVY